MTKEKFNELLYNLCNGDRAALEPIYKEFYHNMVVTALYVLHNESDAEDAASEAMLKLIVYAEHKKTDEYICNPGGFMHTTAKTCALDILRKRKGELNIEDIEVCATDDIARQSVCRFDLIRALSGLTDNERELAIRHFLFGEKIKEINKDCDCHYDSVRRKLRDIKRKINSKL